MNLLRTFVSLLFGISVLVLPLGQGEAADPAEKVLKVFAVYSTPLEEPWNSVIHTALMTAKEKKTIDYTWEDKVNPAEMNKFLSKKLEKNPPDVIFGDAFGCEEAFRKTAAAFPKIAFVAGSSEGPQKPNLATFDSTVHEPAYLCGLIAGKMTKSNIIGVVGGQDAGDNNRNINAFIMGAKEANPKVKVKVAFIGSWYDRPKAKKSALEQIEKGADLIYAERAGAIEAAKEKKILAFGNFIDQNKDAPETVITGPVWNMTPTVEHVIGKVRAGKFEAESLLPLSSLAKGGAQLADWHGWDKKLPADVLKLVKDKEAAIKDGKFKVEAGKGKPKSDD